MIIRTIAAVNLFVICWVPLCAQTLPSFDVATIKPSDAVKKAGFTSGWSFTTSRNGLKAIGSLQTMIRYAYGVEDIQISGGPSWLDRDIFEIDAKAAEPVKGDDLKLMLRKLMADRFRLAIHRETRQLQAYSLVVAKGGPKLQPLSDTDPTIGSFSTGAALLRGSVDLAVFARHLTSLLDRAVVDNTGLKGNWKFDLTWAPDDATAAPSLFTAIQEQLGLKLEATKAPVEVLVIDHADPPSEN